MRFLVATVLLAVEALLQVSVFSRMSWLGAAPQIVLFSVIAWSVARGPAEGMFWGFAGGLLYDLASAQPLGISALSMVVVAAAAGLTGRAMFSSNFVLPVLTIFLSTVLYVIVVGFLLATLHYPTDWRAALSQVALPEAVANSLMAVVLYPLFAFVSARTERLARVEF